ncbi:MAG: HlyD family efflux transporter periplasmic adaptor subunit [Ginsengibacter sp.]
MKQNKPIQFFKLLIAILLLPVIFSSCSNQKDNYDASGTFEANEIIISAEANGVIESLKINEGQILDSGQQIGFIDTTQLFLKKKQLEAQVKAMGYKLPDILAQTAQFKQQAVVTQSTLDHLLKEKIRTENLVKADAATPKQLDDINAQIETVKQQIKAIYKQGEAQTSALKTQRSGISADVSPLYIQIELLNDQLQKSKIINPINGTILTKFAEENEMTTIGKPLYTIADLSTITLRVYITGDQFSSVKLGQKVKVLVDDSPGKSRYYEGTIEWINNKAEFTPKTIQTKDERANLVYAIKISVKNDGTLKIGMYGEVKFN